LSRAGKGPRRRGDVDARCPFPIQQSEIAWRPRVADGRRAENASAGRGRAYCAQGSSQLVWDEQRPTRRRDPFRPGRLFAPAAVGVIFGLEARRDRASVCRRRLGAGAVLLGNDRPYAVHLAIHGPRDRRSVPAGTGVGAAAPPGSRTGRSPRRLEGARLPVLAVEGRLFALVQSSKRPETRWTDEPPPFGYAKRAHRVFAASPSARLDCPGG